MEQLVKATEENIQRAAEIIKKGGLVAFPTETVYGLGACALSKEAVVKIFEAKKRPHFDPLIVHIAHREEVDRICHDIPDQAWQLMESFWPGPLTLVLPKNENIPDIVTAGLDTVAVRMPAHPVALRLIECSGCPIAAPSANRFGHISPTQARDVLSDLGKAVDLILDGGRTVVGIESTVLLVTNQGINLLRPGGVSTEDIERKVGSIKIITHSQKILSPGATKIHYSPRVPLYIFNGSPQELERINEPHLVIMSPIPLSHQSMKVFPLSQDGNLSEIASHLFEEMRTLERMRVCAIIALPVEKKGLGRAIMDRLTRASTGTVTIEGDALVFIDR